MWYDKERKTPVIFTDAQTSCRLPRKSARKMMRFPARFSRARLLYAILSKEQIF